jgi:hypothetical protein
VDRVGGVRRLGVAAHLDVDVHGAAAEPAGVDGVEDGDAGAVRPLDPAREGAGPVRDSRVDAARVRMPDVDRGARPRRGGSTAPRSTPG